MARLLQDSLDDGGYRNTPTYFRITIWSSASGKSQPSPNWRDSGGKCRFQDGVKVFGVLDLGAL
jgi:hypothetical protein